MTRLSVVGLGKVGACIAAALAHRGFDVCGVDVNQHTVSLINAGEPPVFEPGLKEMMAGTRERLRATADCYQAVRDSAVTFIVVSTPSETTGDCRSSMSAPPPSRSGARCGTSTNGTL